MSELLQPADMPLRRVLAELTDEASGGLGLGPFEAYVRLQQKIGRLALDPRNYAQAAITSGGHARDPKLTKPEVIKRNTSTALRICEQLYKDEIYAVEPTNTIEAVAFGNVPRWRQSDYMTFWLLTEAGLRASGSGVAHKLDAFSKELGLRIARHPTLDMAVYNSAQPNKVRRMHYLAHAEVFAEAVKQSDHDPKKALISVLDTRESLGGSTEQYFAKLMGINQYQVTIAETGQPPSAASMSPELAAETQHLMDLGAAVFGTMREQRLALVPQQA